MFRLIKILVLLTIAGNGFGQVAFSGIVLDAESQKPIDQAHVFIVSSTQGTTTGSDGRFKLEVPPGNYELGITHVSYEPYFNEINFARSEENSFSLNPSVQVIPEIEVTAKKKNKRPRYLNRFRRAILGESHFSRNCTINNPEVILFKSKIKGGFNAITTDLLQITNKDLGYSVFLFLEYFESNALTTTYGTKVFFKAHSTSSENQEVLWNKNRLKAYKGSKRHFLEALLADRVKEENFMIRHARITPTNEIEIIKPASRKQIIIENGRRKALSIPEVLAVSHFGKNSFNSPESNFGQISYLQAKVNVIDITNPLNIQPNQLVEYGLWAKAGVANWLPHDYDPNLPNSKNVVYLNSFALNPLSIPLSAIHRGGPPKDGIPAITNPIFTSVKKVKFLQDSDRLLGVVHAGIQKAYPIKILDYHGIVNDQFGDEKIIISFCPLCNSGVAFNGLIAGVEKNFGVSGLLYNSNVLMYDHETHSLWSPILGQAISGKSTGEKLDFIPVVNTTWEDWKNNYPDSEILRTPIDIIEKYDFPLYDNYRNNQQLMFPLAHFGNTLDNKEWILGIEFNGIAKAYPFSVLRKNIKFKDRFNNKDLTIHFDAHHQRAEIKDDLGNLITAHVMYWFAWKSFYPKTLIMKE